MKLLIAATPADSHEFPLPAVARMARARNDKVPFTTTALLEAKAVTAGARSIPLARTKQPDLCRVLETFSEGEALPQGTVQLRFDLGPVILGAVMPQAATLPRILDREAPDAIVVDGSLSVATLHFLGRVQDHPDGAPVGPGLPPTRDGADRTGQASIATGLEASSAASVRACAGAKLAAIRLPALPCFFMQSRVLISDTYLQPAVPAAGQALRVLFHHVRFVGAQPPSEGAPWPDRCAGRDALRRVLLVIEGTIATSDFGHPVEPALSALADQDDLPVIATTGRRPTCTERNPR